jgi:hypothetical protein
MADANRRSWAHIRNHALCIVANLIFYDFIRLYSFFGKFIVINAFYGAM